MRRETDAHTSAIQPAAPIAPSGAPRWRRWLFRLGLGALALAVVMVIGARIYLSTHQAAALVSEELSSKLGLPMQIKSVSTGADSTAVDDVSIGEADGANGGKPWIIAKQIEANSSIVGLIAGGMPDIITLKEGFVTLRFDRDRNLLTQLPHQNEQAGTLPVVRLQNCRLLIQQEGHEDASFSGVDGELRSANNQFVFAGTLTDEFWGRWRLSAAADTDGTAGSATITTVERAPLTPATFKHIPFVPPSLSDMCVAAGTTDAEIKLEYSKARSFHFWVKASPTCSSVSIPSVDLTTTSTTGEVMIQDYQVTLRNIRGHAAGGTMDLNGTLDLAAHPNVYKLKVDAKDMLVKDLPPDWKIEQKVPVKGIGEGRLTGSASLLLTKGKDGFIPGGSGHATIVVPHFVSGQNLIVGLDLRPAGGRFEFESKPGDMSMRLDNESERRWASALAAVLTMLAAPPAQSAKNDNGPAAAAPAHSYFDINLSLKDVDLGELISKINFKLPYKIAGRISFHVTASIPSNAVSDLKSYKLTGTATMPTLTIEDLTLKNVDVKLVYGNGKLTLQDLSARLPTRADGGLSGTFKGTASLGVVPAGDLEANLVLDQLPVDQLLGLVPQLAAEAAGNLSGQFSFKAPANELRNPAKWTGKARLSAPSARAIGWQFQNLHLVADLAEGTLTLARLGGDIEEAHLNTTGEIKLTGQYAFRGHADLTNVDLGSLNKLAPSLRLPVSVAGSVAAHADLTGDLKPMSLKATGTADAIGLRVEEFPVDKLSLKWELTPNRFLASEIHTQLLGGQITGAANIPLRDDAAGEVNLTLKGVDLKQLSKQMPAAASLNLAGDAAGTLRAAIPAAHDNKPRVITAAAELTAAHLKVRNIPADKLRATADYENGVVHYKVEAAALGGTIEADGTYPPEKQEQQPAPDKARPQGHLRVQGLQLARAWRPLGLEDSLGQLSGQVSLRLPYSFDTNGHPVGTGELTLSEVRFGNRELSPRITSVARLTAGELRFEQIESPLATGMIRGGVFMNLQHLDRSRAYFNLRQVAADRLLFAIPALASSVDSRLDVEIRTSLGREIRGGAMISGVSGKYAGISVGLLRLPVEWDLVPSRQRGVVTVRDFTAEVAGGIVGGKVHYDFYGDVGSTVDGAIKFRDVSVASLAHSGSLSSYGVGKATGEFKFSGRDVRSFNDVTGTLVATLGRAQLNQIPVFSQIMPFLGTSSGVTDQRSSIRANLSGGVWHIERLALVGSNLQIYADGTVTTSQRLNLNVTANTGQLLVSPLALRLAGIAAPVMVGPVPVSAIVNLSTYISNRTVNLQVTGTIANPVIQIQPLRLLTQEAIQFFLNQNNIPTP